MEENTKQKIKEELISMQDKKYKEFHKGLCPGTENIVGIRVPILRNYAKELLKQHNWKTLIKNIDNNYYEEIMLQGMIIGLAKMETEERLNYISEFVPKIDNWAICDTFCAGLKFTNRNKDIVWEFIKKYQNSRKEFELRFLIVMLLDYYITDKYIDEVIKILDKTKHDGYYVKMAIAWTISVLYVKYPKITIEYLKNNTLDDFTYNKALQKIIESYRVSEEDKNIMRKMKR